MRPYKLETATEHIARWISRNAPSPKWNIRVIARSPEFVALRVSGNKKERRKERCEDETASERTRAAPASANEGGVKLVRAGSRRRGARRRYPRNKSPF